MSDPSAFAPVVRAVLAELWPLLKQEGIPLEARWLSPKQVQLYCGLDITTLERYRRLSIGPAWVKLGPGTTSPIRYDREVIDAWMTSQSIHPGLGPGVEFGGGQ